MSNAELDAINRRVEEERERRLKLAAIAATTAEQDSSPQSPGRGQTPVLPAALSAERPAADVQPMDTEESHHGIVLGFAKCSIDIFYSYRF